MSHRQDTVKISLSGEGFKRGFKTHEDKNKQVDYFIISIVILRHICKILVLCCKPSKLFLLVLKEDSPLAAFYRRERSILRLI